MRKHEDVKLADEERLEQDWRNEAVTSDDYEEAKDEFIKMLSEFEMIWDGHLGRIQNAKHRIALSPADAKPIQSALYWASPKARHFEKNEIYIMFSEEFIEPVQIEWTSAILLAPKKDG